MYFYSLFTKQKLTFVLYKGLLKSQSGATNKYPHLETFRDAWMNKKREDVNKFP